MFEVTLPQTSDELEESLIVFWNVQEGDRIAKGDLLVEVQTQKAIFEIEAEISGTIKQILVKRGESAKVSDVLAIIEPASTVARSTPSELIPSAEGEEKPIWIQEQRPFVRTSPRLRNLARELNVDLTAVRGSGPNGSLTEQDIRLAASPETIKRPNSNVVKITGIRQAIAKRMVDSLQQSAQLSETIWADVTVLSKLRKESGLRISWNSLVLFNVIKALQEHTALNAHVNEDCITLFEEVHLGIAVDTLKGLFVPVVKNAENLTIVELQAEVSRLVDKANEGTLSLAEMSGSTFTVSNLGNYGIQFFTPIINRPEAAILGVGKIEQYIGMVQGEVVQKERIPLSLTFDHRALDGVPAARFLQTLVHRLEHPEFILS